MERELGYVASQVGQSVVSIKTTNAKTGEVKMGGGVVIAPNQILTTEAIIGDANGITILLQNGEKIDTSQIEMLCSDYETNICNIKLRRQDLKPVQVSDQVVKSGSIGIVVGNSLFAKGLDVSYGTLASSWIGGDDPYDSPLLTLRLGLGVNSGGMPVFDHKGRLIGIVEGLISGEKEQSLLLPARACLKVVEAMDDQKGKINRGWIGVFVGHPCPYGTVGEGVDKDNLKPNMIAQIARNGFAKEAGLKPGDVIVSCQGQKITCSRDLRMIVSMLTPGSEAELVVLQDGKEVTKRIKVGELPQQQSLRRCSSRSI